MLDYWSTVLCCTIQTHIMDNEVKVTDFKMLRGKAWFRWATLSWDSFYYASTIQKMVERAYNDIPFHQSLSASGISNLHLSFSGWGISLLWHISSFKRSLVCRKATWNLQNLSCLPWKKRQKNLPSLSSPHKSTYGKCPKIWNTLFHTF